MAKLCSAYYSSNGTWVCPAGVTQVWLLGQAGGAGGDGGRNGTFNKNYGGIGTTPYIIQVTVVPNTSYSVTIGNGGTGGAPRTTTTPNGGVGGTTSFGALASWVGASFSYPSVLTGLTVRPISENAAASISSGFAVKTGNSGTASGSYEAGISGAPGYTGSVPGTGGNANSAGTGTNGTNATGIGAGGGAGGSGSTAGGSGGNGAPGQLWVIWVE